MKFQTPKIRLQCSAGIYLNDAGISWCVVEKRPWGSKVLDCGQQSCAKQDWAVALNGVLEKVLTDTGTGTSVVIGLPPSQVFFATLPAPTKNENAEALLAASHCCSSIPAAEVSADMLLVKINGKTFAAVAAGRKKDLEVLTGVPRKLGFRFIRVEPGPIALLRVSNSNKVPKITLRLLIEGRRTLATLAYAQQALLWRSMELPEEGSIDAMVSAARTLESYAIQQLGVSGLESIVIEGTSAQEVCEKLTMDLGDRVSVVESVGPKATATAKGLAMAGLERDKPALDVARSLAPPPQLADLIPRGEVALLGAAVICLALWMWAVGTIAKNKAERVEEDISRSALLKNADDSKLKDEKKRLASEVQAVNGFLQNRILWTEYLSQLSGRIPKGLQMVDFHGEYELQAGMKKNEKKSEPHLMLGFEGMVPRNLSAPAEVDEVLAKIRAAPAIVRDFPEVELAMLRVNKNTETRKTTSGDPSNFKVMCFPKGKGSGKKSGPAKDEAPSATPAKAE